MPSRESAITGRPRRETRVAGSPFRIQRDLDGERPVGRGGRRDDFAESGLGSEKQQDQRVCANDVSFGVFTAQATAIRARRRINR